MKARHLVSAFAAALFVVTTSCQTARLREFDQVKDGMDKAEVLELAGNPTRTQRWQGKDRWIYVYSPANAPAESKEIHFSEGHVVYKGAPIAPEVSAEEQDRRNEESNLALEKSLKEQDEAAKDSIRQGADWLNGGGRSQKSQPKSNSAD